jgi:hypothetical protein
MQSVLWQRFIMTDAVLWFCPRRRPFLVKGLENTLNKFILSLEFYDEAGRKKIAVGMCVYVCVCVSFAVNIINISSTLYAASVLATKHIVITFVLAEQHVSLAQLDSALFVPLHSAR